MPPSFDFNEKLPKKQVSRPYFKGHFPPSSLVFSSTANYAIIKKKEIEEDT